MIGDRIRVLEQKLNASALTMKKGGDATIYHTDLWQSYNIQCSFQNKEDYFVGDKRPDLIAINPITITQMNPQGSSTNIHWLSN